MRHLFAMRFRHAARTLLAAGWLAAATTAFPAAAATGTPAPPPAKNSPPAPSGSAKAGPARPAAGKAAQGSSSSSESPGSSGSSGSSVPSSAGGKAAAAKPAEPEAASSGGSKADADADAKPTSTPEGGAGGKQATSKASSGREGGSSGKTVASSKSAGKSSTKSAGKPKKGDKAAHSKKTLPRKPGSEPGEPDEGTRRIIAGTATTKSSRESPELRAMRELDLALFPSSDPGSGTPWPAEGSILADPSVPAVHASGLPPAAAPPARPAARPASDLSWLRQLTMPDIPVRWDERVIRYLEYYKDNPRGRSMVASWIKRSGRYGAAIRKVLREQGLPEDIVWLSLVESGFDPTIQSPVGAAGLWQFMPDGARIYGLTVDRWIDERLDPERSTLAAARYLSDLRKRFGGWELAFAAYNMGYGGLLASIRKYNTNDFWELSRLEAGMPLETALYVPKIVAMAIVARNKSVFGCDGVELEPAVSFDKVAVGSGISLKTVAAASGAGITDIEDLNPQLLAGRTPPVMGGDQAPSKWVVRVPPGSAATAAKSIPKLLEKETKLERYLVRWGESLDDIATYRGVSRSTLQGLNDLRRDEVIRPGTVIFVPAAPGVGVAAAANMVVTSPSVQPIVVVPAQTFVYPNRRRVFYRVIAGDTLRDVASVLRVKPDELCRWNMLDPSVVLHEGMALQAYIPERQGLAGVFVLEEKDARVLRAGSPEFFSHFEGRKGRKRIEIAAREGDTFQALAKRYGLTMGMLERINHRSRSTPLNVGDKLVVYVPSGSTAPAEPLERLESKAADTAVAIGKPAGEEKGDKPSGEDDDKEDEVKPAVLQMTPEDPPVEGVSPASVPNKAGRAPAAP